MILLTLSIGSSFGSAGTCRTFAVLVAFVPVVSDGGSLSSFMIAFAACKADGDNCWTVAILATPVAPVLLTVLFRILVLLASSHSLWKEHAFAIFVL